ncbi:MAG: FAD-dependent oxidoreductase, partial [Bacteroidetes bacterium]|nr:FAD-dependent oxidoreductase [Bacteroidota bacterium]
ESFHSSEKSKKVVALLGDGTFFHSGLASLVNAVYTRANILVIIFDNRTTGMTGHQSHPGASRTSKYHEIDLPALLKGLGIEVVETINPFNVNESYEKVNNAMEHEGVSVLVSRAPCIFLPDFKDKIDKRMKIVVDPNRCNTCENHEDSSLSCSRCYAPKSNLSRAKSKLVAEVSIAGSEQLCPANICNHGFFNAVLETDFKSAIEIVRDKMLFARTCGDICHRPCELFSKEENIIPIKLIKKAVSSFDELFLDFSAPIKRAKEAKKQNKSVVIIGAGPAGLSAAYDLIQAGYDVSVFEKESKAGGMVTFAIPYFRMDKSGFDFEAMQLEKMGVKFYFNRSLGNDFTLEKLEKEFDSTVLAIGMNRSKTLDIVEKNISSSKKSDALSFLKMFNQRKNNIKENSIILIIGGGNSAIDAARSAKKLHPEIKVVVSCIETESTMPAFVEEVKHAADEGVKFIFDSYVEKVSAGKNDQINIVLHSFSNKMELSNFNCDHVITAIGQVAEEDIIGTLQKDESTRVKNENSYTGYGNVFVAGDVSSGNNISVIGAIASGKKAAIGVRKLLENYKFEYEGEIALERLNTQTLPKRNSLDQDTDVELEKFDLYQSCKKCNHCIDNFGCPAMVKENGKVQIDMSRCNLCGLCIDVCPNNAIKWETETVEN